MDSPPRMDANLAANPKFMTCVELPETCMASPPGLPGRRASMMPRLRFREIHSGCPVDVVPGHGYGPLLIASDGRQNVDDIQRVTGAQFGAAVAQAHFAQVLAAIGLQRDAA